MKTTTLRLTSDIEKVKMCPSLKPGSVEDWEEFAGRPIKVFLPPIPTREALPATGIFCDSPCVWTVVGALTENGVPVGVCHHIVDVD